MNCVVVPVIGIVTHMAVWSNVVELVFVATVCVRVSRVGN